MDRHTNADRIPTHLAAIRVETPADQLTAGRIRASSGGGRDEAGTQAVIAAGFDRSAASSNRLIHARPVPLLLTAEGIDLTDHLAALRIAAGRQPMAAIAGSAQQITAAIAIGSGESGAEDIPGDVAASWIREAGLVTTVRIVASNRTGMREEATSEHRIKRRPLAFGNLRASHISTADAGGIP